MVLLQQIEQCQEAVDKDHEHERISETVESVAASTSSNISETDVQVKNLHTIERLILTPKLEHDETFESATPISKPAKRGRPPKITLDESQTNETGFVHNKLFRELTVLFTSNVLPVEVIDHHLFRNFLKQIAPGYPLASAEEFRTKIIPSYCNTSFNYQAFMKNK